MDAFFDLKPQVGLNSGESNHEALVKLEKPLFSSDVTSHIKLCIYDRTEACFSAVSFSN